MTAKFPEKRGGALFPGTFDPLTKGHLDIIERGVKIFGRIVVGVGYNASKQSSVDVEKRVESIRKSLSGLDNVEVMAYDCLTVDAAERAGVSVIVRGVRSVTDFEYERAMAEANKKIGGIETVILLSAPELQCVSSSLVRELQRYGKNVDEFLAGND